jgi:UDP-2,3-diacylglucosamine hydrolase
MLIFFVFGHRHLPLNIEVADGVHYVNTGDWVTHFTFAEFDGESIELKSFKPDKD